MTAEKKTGDDSVEFEKIHMEVGEAIQMQPAGTRGAPHFSVRFLGGLKDISLMTTLPKVNNECIWMHNNDEYIFRVLAGCHVYGFSTHLVKARSQPFPYAHFAYPKQVRAKRIRRAQRIQLSLAGEAHLTDDSRLSLRLHDLSEHGALIECKQPLGPIGQQVRVLVPIELDDLRRQLVLAATIRNQRAEQGHLRYGVQFEALADDDGLALRYFINHHLAQARHPGD